MYGCVVPGARVCADCSSCSKPVTAPTTGREPEWGGATFPYPIYSKWFNEYNKLHPDVQINYQSIGSGGGIRQVGAKTVDFGASDMPLNDEQLKTLNVPIVQLPTVLGSVIPAYNLSGVSAEIKFTPEALAGIYLGRLRSGMTRR